MAAFTENAMKLAGIAAALPFVAVAAGFRLRFVQAKETSGAGVRRVYRVCDLPAYYVADRSDLKCDGDISYPRNSLEAGISVVRKAMQGFFGNFALHSSSVDRVREALLCRLRDPDKATYKYVRDNTEDFTRAAVVAGAGIGGFFFRHRGNPWRRLSYAFLAAAPCAVICYPSKLLQFFQSPSDFVRGVWERNLLKRVEHKYYKGEPKQVSKASALYMFENFDAISLSDFNEPDFENLRTVDLCRGDNVQEFNTADLCLGDSVEEFNTADLCHGDDVEEFNTADQCRGDNVNEKPSPAELCQAESSEEVSSIDCCQSENMDKLAMGDFCTVEHVETMGITGISNAKSVPDNVDCTHADNSDKPAGVDAGNVEKVGEVDKVYCRSEGNIDKPSSVDVYNFKAENVGKPKLRTVSFNAKSKEKFWVVENCNLEDTEKKAKGSTDQSNPEDKDMYSTRSA